MASPESTEHNKLLLWSAAILEAYVGRLRLGEIFINRVCFRLSDDDAPEPDIGFVRASRWSIVRPTFVAGAPDLAVEIVSAESEQRDYQLKRHLYERAGVKEYWILDPDDERTTFLVRGPRGFAQAKLVGGVFASRVVKGFRLDTRWLWQRPRPDTLSIIREVIGQE